MFDTKRIGVLVIGIFLIYAFQEYSDFQKRVINNYIAFVEKLPHEKVYLHTDKSAYVAGENIWFRAYGVHALVNIPGIPSRFVYVDLVDKRDSLVERVKVGQRDSCFYGQIHLAKELPQGEYSLRAYTYNLQKQGNDYLFKKKIRVINPLDARVQTEVTYRKGRNGYIASIKLSDGKGEPFALLPVLCTVGKRKSVYSDKKIYTDRDGMLEVKVDSANEVVKLAFAGGKPFHFERYIRVPGLSDDFDVQFFPEGGILLAGVRQRVAFKAIGSDGYPVEVNGTVYQDSVPFFEMVTEHDGMGSFLLSVNGGKKFRAFVKAANGMEKWFDLPESRADGWGISVTREGDIVDYLVMQGENATLAEKLYVLVHSQGVVFDIRLITGKSRGKIDRKLLPEGISQVVLLDEEGKVYSQRLFFVQHDERPRLTLKSNKRKYVARELVELEIGFDGKDEQELEGIFSLSVTDDQKVEIDTLEDHILSNLLLTSNLRGYINQPGYYFGRSTGKEGEHLDLVMQTHGWTRFDPGKIARGEFPKVKYEIEVAQMVSGHVKNFWGKKSPGANIALISNYGHCYMVETDEDGNFVIDNLLFNDSTRFLVQALSAKGNQRVEVAVQEDELIPPLYDLPNTMNEKKKDEDFLKRCGLDYYYENGEKVYVLDEVTVTRRKQNKAYSFYDNLAEYRLDSVRLAEYAGRNDLFLVFQEIPGISFTKDSSGLDVILLDGLPMRVFVNDMEEDMMMVRSISLDMLLNISVLGRERARMFLGSSDLGGILSITAKQGYWMGRRRERLNLAMFKLMGYQEPEEFYVPRYDVDSVRQDNRYDERTTIYWNPVVKVEPGKNATVAFYTADIYGKYTIILEGVTRNGVIFRERWALDLK